MFLKKINFNFFFLNTTLSREFNDYTEKKSYEEKRWKSDYNGIHISGLPGPFKIFRCRQPRDKDAITRVYMRTISQMRSKYIRSRGINYMVGYGDLSWILHPFALLRSLIIMCNYAIVFTYVRPAVIIAPARSLFCIRAFIFTNSLRHNRPWHKSRRNTNF